MRERLQTLDYTEEEMPLPLDSANIARAVGPHAPPSRPAGPASRIPEDIVDVCGLAHSGRFKV